MRPAAQFSENQGSRYPPHNYPQNVPFQAAPQPPQQRYLMGSRGYNIAYPNQYASASCQYYFGYQYHSPIRYGQTVMHQPPVQIPPVVAKCSRLEEVSCSQSGTNDSGFFDHSASFQSGNGDSPHPAAAPQTHTWSYSSPAYPTASTSADVNSAASTARRCHRRQISVRHYLPPRPVAASVSSDVLPQSSAPRAPLLERNQSLQHAGCSTPSTAACSPLDASVADHRTPLEHKVSTPGRISVSPRRLQMLKRPTAAYTFDGAALNNIASSQGMLKIGSPESKKLATHPVKYEPTSKISPPTQRIRPSVTPPKNKENSQVPLNRDPFMGNTTPRRAGPGGSGKSAPQTPTPFKRAYRRIESQHGRIQTGAKLFDSGEAQTQKPSSDVDLAKDLREIIESDPLDLMTAFDSGPLPFLDGSVEESSALQASIENLPDANAPRTPLADKVARMISKSLPKKPPKKMSNRWLEITCGRTKLQRELTASAKSFMTCKHTS